MKHTAGVWSDDYSKEDVRKQGLFLHQMVHIWQYERLGRIRFLIRYAREFVRCRLKAAAMFRYEERQAFAEAYLEAQAKMVEHYFVARATGRTRSDLQVSLAGTGFYGL
ncbi:MAG: hypothetical protein QOI38_2422 [Sphingomonadales bacterium]|nr:hypothetical protein [Sphingomonadales bacterium]